MTTTENCYWYDGSLWVFDTRDASWHVCNREDFGKQTHDRLTRYACGGDTPTRMGWRVVKFYRPPTLSADAICEYCKLDHLTNWFKR